MNQVTQTAMQNLSIINEVPQPPFTSDTLYIGSGPSYYHKAIISFDLTQFPCYVGGMINVVFSLHFNRVVSGILNPKRCFYLGILNSKNNLNKIIPTNITTNLKSKSNPCYLDFNITNVFRQIQATKMSKLNLVIYTESNFNCICEFHSINSKNPPILAGTFTSNFS